MTKGFTNISWQCRRSSLQLCGEACSLVSTCTCLFSPNLRFLGTATVLSIMISLFLFLAVILITPLSPLFAPNSCSHEQIIQPSKLSFQHSVWTSCCNKPQFLSCRSSTNASLLLLFSITLPFAHLSICIPICFSFLWYSPDTSLVLVFFTYPDFSPCTVLVFPYVFFLSFHLLSQFLAVFHTSWPHSAPSLL